jgi:hypothetical protein
MRRGAVVRLGIVGSLCSATVTLVACLGDDPPPTPLVAVDADAPADSASHPPDGSSVEDAAPAVDAGADAGRHCARYTPPSGAAQSFCADFDGADLDEGWNEAILTDGGTLDRTKSFFFSAPQALLALPAKSGFDEGGALFLERGGPDQVTEISLRMRLNPALPGGIRPADTSSYEVARVGTDRLIFELRYTDRGETSNLGADYKGFFAVRMLLGGAAQILYDQLPVQPQFDAWTDVRITWRSTGNIAMTFNGVSVLNLSGSAPPASTLVRARVGALAKGALGAPTAMRIDDVEIAVKREQ